MSAVLALPPPAWVGHLIAALAILAAFAASVRGAGRPVPATAILLAAAVAAGMGVGRIDLLAGGSTVAAVLGGILGHRAGRGARPAALRLASRKLRRRPFGALLAARFMTPLAAAMPVAARRLGLPFQTGNGTGAVLWAGACAAAGLVLGVALRLMLGADPRAAALVAVGVLAVAAAILALPILLRLADRAATALHAALSRRLDGRDGRMSGFVRAGIGRDRATLLMTAALFAVLLASLYALAVLTVAVVDRGALVDADEAIANLVRLARSPSADVAMVVVTTLGDTPVTSAVAVAALLALAWRRAWGALIAFALVLIATAAAVPALKVAFAVGRPTEGLYGGAYSYSYPSGHAAFAAAIYLPIAAIAGRGRSLAVKVLLLAVAMICAAAISISRVYVAAHWPSDVVAGMLFGLGALAIYMLAQRRLAFDRRTGAAAGFAALAALVAIGGWHVATRYQQRFETYRLDRPEAVEAIADWRRDGWRKLPAGRYNLRGTISDAFVLQWAGDLDSLAAMLGQDGWRPVPNFAPRAILAGMLAGTEALSAPVLPRLDRGHPPAATFVRAGLDGDHRQVLRVWTTRFRAESPEGPPIHVGAIIEERMLRPLGLITWPRRDSREPDGAPLLARILPAATIVTRDAVAIDDLGPRRVAVALAQPQSLAMRMR